MEYIKCVLGINKILLSYYIEYKVINLYICLLKDGVLDYQPEKASKIINACVVLYKICITNYLPTVNNDEINVENVDLGMIHDQGLPDNELAY